jgi:hypothetical protein
MFCKMDLYTSGIEHSVLMDGYDATVFSWSRPKAEHVNLRTIQTRGKVRSEVVMFAWARLVLDRPRGIGMAVGAVLDPEEGLGAAAFALLVFGGAGGWCLYRYFQNTFAKLQLGSVDFSLPDVAVYHPGNHVPVRVAMEPRSDVTLNQIVVELYGQEHGTRRS